jgi:hypothetical protein
MHDNMVNLRWMPWSKRSTSADVLFKLLQSTFPKWISCPAPDKLYSSFQTQGGIFLELQLRNQTGLEYGISELKLLVERMNTIQISTTIRPGEAINPEK